MLAAGPVPFEARLLDGTTHSGQVTALNGRELVLETADGPQTFPLAKLALLARAPAPEGAAPASSISVELTDGSTLAADEFGVAAQTAKIRRGGAAHEIPTRAIRSVRFGSADGRNPQLDRQWSEIAETKAAGDLVVVRKNDALDYLEGVLRDVDDATVQFELDGEVRPLKRAKIEGLVYAHPRPAELPESAGTLVALDGSKLQLEAIELVEGRLKLKTPAGTAHEVPLEGILRLDFSSGKMAYLSDLDPESAAFTPLVGFAQPPAALLEFYAYRRDSGFEASPLRLDGKVYKKGLALASRTELVYKLPGKFRLLRATVGIDDNVRATGSARLEIKGDGRTLWQGDVRGGDPARELEVDVAGVKRLAIVADYGAGGDVGDRVLLAEAQITK
jgi:hypothetical protein